MSALWRTRTKIVLFLIAAPVWAIGGLVWAAILGARAAVQDEINVLPRIVRYAWEDIVTAWREGE